VNLSLSLSLYLYLFAFESATDSRFGSNKLIQVNFDFALSQSLHCSRNRFIPKVNKYIKHKSSHLRSIKEDEVDLIANVHLGRGRRADSNISMFGSQARCGGDGEGHVFVERIHQRNGHQSAAAIGCVGG
jgi:hypothetical protein